MKAMMLRSLAPVGEHPLEAVELEDPQPGPGEVAVAVRACGVCRTDLHVVEGDLPEERLPVVPGHQVVGEVEALGPGCERLAPGDRVGIAWLRGTCGACRFCRTGRENLCEESVYTGYHEHGGYAERAVVREDWAYRIPGVFGDAEATPLLCAGLIGYRAWRRAEVPDGGKLGIFGFGSSAHVVIQIARHRGCEVHVGTRSEGHRELARELGAASTGSPHEPLPERVDGAIVFAPAGEIVPVALRSVRRGGTVSLAGIHMSPIPEMTYEEHLFHEKQLRSVESNTREDARSLLREAAEIPVRPEVTTYPLAEANEALVDLKRSAIDGTGVLIPGG